MNQAKIMTKRDLKALATIAKLAGVLLAASVDVPTNGAAPKRRVYKRRKPKAERTPSRRKATPRYRIDEAPVPAPAPTEEVPF